MLPASYFPIRFPMRRHMIAAITAAAVALPALPAHAFNQREQDVLKGVAAVLLFQGLVREAKKNNPPPPAAHPPVYAPHPPVYAPPPPVYAPVHAPVSIHRTAPAYAFGSYSLSERRAIQRGLARAGYYYGPIDGAFGRGTYNASLNYARAIGASAQMSSQAGAYAVYDRLLFGA